MIGGLLVAFALFIIVKTIELAVEFVVLVISRPIAGVTFVVAIAMASIAIAVKGF